MGKRIRDAHVPGVSAFPGTDTCVPCPSAIGGAGGRSAGSGCWTFQRTGLGSLQPLAGDHRGPHSCIGGRVHGASRVGAASRRFPSFSCLKLICPATVSS